LPQKTVGHNKDKGYFSRSNPTKKQALPQCLFGRCQYFTSIHVWKTYLNTLPHYLFGSLKY